jgi:ADP-dependent NAD(P)H-hydrate dehydratase / NAD(P)H-hydrate epimerase
MKISTVSEMRALDMRAIEEFGIAEELLMENAGQAAYFVLLKEFGIKDKTFTIFCGTGNNGGDGLVVARKIHSSGGVAKVYLLGDPGKYRGAAKINLGIVSRLPIEVQRYQSLDLSKEDITQSDLIVDAILGTGIIGDVRGQYREIIESINDSGKPVLSIDIPSGIHGDTGQVMGAAVKADYTVTFGLPKIGNMLFPGFELGGKLYVSHISFPPSIYNSDSLKIAINHGQKLPPRNINDHKGDFGEVLFIAGAASYFGAPYFSALSFLKAGGGYSRLAAPHAIIPSVAAKGSEIVFIPQRDTGSGSISMENKDALLSLSEKMDMVVIGPGLSLDRETQQLVRELAQAIDKPILIDGDGISALCQDLNIIKERQAATILTPHSGEMSRMTNVSVTEIEQHKIDILQRKARNLQAIVVLKGAHSLIGCPDGRVFINMSGNSGMATAGSGDVLTGAIAAMFGLGLSIPEAVRKGVFIHGFAGDLAAEDKGEDGITAQDILDYLPLAVKMDRLGLSEMMKERYAGAQIV